MSHVFKLQISPHVRNPNCSIKCLGLGKIARESGVGTAEGGGEKKSRGRVDWRWGGEGKKTRRAVCVKGFRENLVYLYSNHILCLFLQTPDPDWLAGE